MTLEETIVDIGKRAKAASADLMSLPTNTKNAVLGRMADLLIAEKEYIQSENQKDLQNS